MKEVERQYRYQPDPHHKGEVASDIRTEEMTLNMGPQHPSTHGVLRVVLQTDGELVLQATPHIGYLHRCAEKIAEKLGYRQFTPYTDRLDYLAAMNNNLGFALAVEKLGGIEVPARADYLRVIFAELNRIASHLVATGTYGLDMGAFTPFVYCFREREYILDLFEAACGARLTYSYITIGGVRDDLPAGWIERCREFLDYFEPKIAEYNDLLSYNHIFIHRTANVGVCPPDLALAYGLTGPVSARQRRRLGPAEGHAVLPVRGVRLRCPGRSRPAGGARRLLGPLLRPHPGDDAVGADHPPGIGQARRRARPGQGAARGEVARRRDLLRGRESPRATGLLPGLRRRDQSLPAQDPRAELLQSLGPAGAGPPLSPGGHCGAVGQSGYCHGGGGSLMYTFERPPVEYKGLSLTIVRLATKWGRLGISLLLRFAWGIFFAAVLALTAFVWLVGRFINPLLPWFIRDLVVVVGLLAFVCIVAIIGIWAERKVAGPHPIAAGARCAPAPGTAGPNPWRTA